MKLLKINLIKYMKDLYSENYRILMRKIKENLNRDPMFLWIIRFNIWNMTIIPKLAYSFDSISVKIPVGFCGY